MHSVSEALSGVGLRRSAPPAASSPTPIGNQEAVEAGKVPGPKINAHWPIHGKETGITLLQLHQLTGPDDASRTVEYWVAKRRALFQGYNYIHGGAESCDRYGAQSMASRLRASVSIGSRTASLASTIWNMGDGRHGVSSR